MLLLGAAECKSPSPMTPADVSDILHTQLHVADMKSLVLQYFSFVAAVLFSE